MNVKILTTTPIPSHTAALRVVIFFAILAATSALEVTPTAGIAILALDARGRRASTWKNKRIGNYSRNYFGTRQPIVVALNGCASLGVSTTIVACHFQGQRVAMTHLASWALGKPTPAWLTCISRNVIGQRPRSTTEKLRTSNTW